MKTITCLSVAFLFFISCKTHKDTAEAKSTEQKTETVEAQPVEQTVEVAATSDSLLAYIERTACYGQCPMYKFSIYRSGYAVYEGKRFVEKLGKYEARFKPPVMAEIRSKAEAAKYFDFKDEYPKTASDFPATKTAVVLDGKRKNIMDGSNAPAALKEFEKYLDSVKDAAEWVPLH